MAYTTQMAHWFAMCAIRSADALASTTKAFRAALCRWLVFRDEVMRKPDGRDVLFKGRPLLTEDWVSKQVRPLRVSW